MKKTKQGVLDLNHLKGKSVGRKVELPPEPEEDQQEKFKQRQSINRYKEYNDYGY